MLFILNLFFISISFTYTNNIFRINNKLSILNEIKDTAQYNVEFDKLFYDVLSTFFYNCSEDLKKMDLVYEGIERPYRFPLLLRSMGYTLNDIQDETECLDSFDNTNYLIAVINVNYFSNKEDKILRSFLNIHKFANSACVTEKCKDPFISFSNLFVNFNNMQNDDKNIYTNEKPKIIDDKKEEAEKKTENKVFNVFFYIFFVYILIKLFIGIMRLIYLPKGYDIHGEKILREKKKNMLILNEKDENNNNELEQLGQDNEYKSSKEYNPIYDHSSQYPIWLKIMIFFDFFNDYMLLSSKRNKYFNDNGLEVINFLRAIVLYFYILSTTFTTLLGLPSKDILNKSFFASDTLMIYRFSSNATVCWIFLEAAFTAYKLMQFIKTKMNEYIKVKKNKRYYINLLIIFGKFILLFIPKIALFIICYYIFYYDIIKFKSFFKSKTIMRYVVEEVITKDIVCNNQTSIIFTKFFTFTNDANDFKTCYDFTFIYINIFYYILIFIASLYLIFVFRKPIIEIFFIVFYFIFFIGLMFVVDETNRLEKENWNTSFGEEKEKEIYSYYHFKGQDYTTKIFYLAIGVYNLGFIFGVLCFNYEILKKKKNKNNQNNKNINVKEKRIEKKPSVNDSFKIDSHLNSKNTLETIDTEVKLTIEQYKQKKYYPLLFLYSSLKWYKKIKFSIKIIIILICLALQLLNASFFKIYSEINKKNAPDNLKKNDPNFDRNYVLEMELDNVLKFYFLFERHIFLILFFIICITLITLPRKRIFKKLINSTFVTAVSRAGFTIVCLSYILTNFSFCGFIIKIKFSIPTFIIISIGNFLIIFVVCILINIVFELPIRIFIKTILRLDKKKKKDNLQEQFLNNNNLNPSN